jgi:DeoR/GlpR family transcriptional regulator of sugar metabolism
MAVKMRRAIVEERVLQLGEVKYADLARELEVSEMTIRRDIERLEKRGVARRVTGGAIAVTRKVDEPSFQTRLTDAMTGKSHIADAVVEMLLPGETVILDSGSTVLAVARALRGRDLGLTVITPSILAAVELSEEPGTTVIVTGGELRTGELSLVGPDAAETFAKYNADTFVAGVAGVDPERGLSDYHRGESAVKKAAMSGSDRVIVAVDSSKLGRSTLVNIAPAASADVIVCDAADDDAVVLDLRRQGIDVICIENSDAASDQGTDVRQAPEASTVG